MSGDRLMRIKLTVANRTYPLNVRLEEEARLRKATKHIGEIMQELEQAYSVSDKQDLLAMTAIQLATALESYRSKNFIAQEEAEQELDRLIAKLGAFL